MATDGGSGNWVRSRTSATNLSFHAPILQQSKQSSSDKGLTCLRGTAQPIISAEAGQLMMYAGGGMTQMVQMQVMHERAWTCRLGRVMCTRAWEFELHPGPVL